MTTEKLGPIICSFFQDHLKAAKGLSPTSIKSYRDTIRIFLSFMVSAVNRKISRLSLQDLTFERTREFLDYLEHERHNHIRTRNQRLAMLHTFFDYLATRSPEMVMTAERVAAIPTKRVAPPGTRYLQRDEIATLFTTLPKNGTHAVRDRALLLFLYNTGARVQEVAELRVTNLDLDPQPRVRLHGKGDRWRVCPLWNETVQQLRVLLQDNPTVAPAERPVFTSHKGRPLTRFGIYKIVRRHTGSLFSKSPDGSQRAISPHIFRHTAAVHLLESGVDVNVIRGWLGHMSLDTTNRYAEITIPMKEAAVRACQPPIPFSEALPTKPVWRDDQNLLNWLASL